MSSTRRRRPSPVRRSRGTASPSRTVSKVTEMTEGTSTVDTLLGLPPEQVAAWLERVTVGEAVGGEPVNWHGLAFTAASRAVTGRNPVWAAIAVRIYEDLARRAQPRDAEGFVMASMRVRAAMIEAFGELPGDELRDSQPLARWFRRIPTVTYAEAAGLARSPALEASPPADLLKLREIKNAL